MFNCQLSQLPATNILNIPLSVVIISSFKIRGIGATMQGSNAKSFVGSSGGNAGRELDLQELDLEELKESYDDDLTGVGDGMGCQATWSLSSPLCSPIHPW